jgi:hypothetical protein
MGFTYESTCALRHSTESELIMEYLFESEFIFETALAHESADPGILLPKETEGRKSRETVPLKERKMLSMQHSLSIHICSKNNYCKLTLSMYTKKN